MAKSKRGSRRLGRIHPGEVLREDYMKPLGISMNQLALALRVPDEWMPLSPVPCHLSPVP